MGIILDTCIWIGLSEKQISVREIMNLTNGADIYCSVITLGELAFGIASCRDAQERAKRQSVFDELSASQQLTIAPTTAALFGELATTLKNKTNPRSYYNDLWIAAQAVEAGFALLTDNKSDFKDLPGLKLLNL
ncbi:hypothetical protein FACS1894107_02970 [Planctomycetales bacterium]|nr:hypothetical protein FACS1894107_02970 [Planctomycetales bacterium]GHS96930.1 hypothetical protein FACS1894108_02460 [Planctomycetales bacterium]